MKAISTGIKNIWKNKQGRIGLIMVSMLAMLAIFAPILTPYSPYDYEISRGFLRPSISHPLGTDKNGVDILTQILYGTRVSLIIGMITGISVTVLGAVLGIAAGYFGKVTQNFILQLIQLLMVIPTLPLMIVLNNVSSSYAMMIFIFVAFGWAGTARIVRAQVLAVKNSNYVKCAELYGGSKWYILGRHILPSVAHLLIMNCALSCAGFMIAEAGLSFLGLGDPSAISWGKILVAAEESAFTGRLWAWVLAPGAAIFFAVTGFMKIGFALEEIVNPRMKPQKVKKSSVDQLPSPGTPAMWNDNYVLQIDQLSVSFETAMGVIHAVEDVTIHVAEGESVALVGESGCGKSVTGLSSIKLIDTRKEFIQAACIRLKTSNGSVVSVMDANEEEMEAYRGKEVAMIYQDPSSSLNPVMTIGAQIEEALIYHTKLNKNERKYRAIQLLEEVGITDAAIRYEQYPHQCSGGMKQRILIAMAMACSPKLLIADEPTTALDVSIQAQILAIIKKLRYKNKMAMLLISHDLSVIKRSTDRIYVMYCGKVVEEGMTKEVMENPYHPYTKGLIQTVPDMKEKVSRFVQIPKNVPHPSNKPSGCYFSERCEFCTARCKKEMPPLLTTDSNRKVRCFHWLQKKES